MIKKIFLVAILLFSTACAVTTYQPPLTVDTVTEKCQPVEKWRLSPMGIEAFVVIYDKCFTHSKLLLIAVRKDKDLPPDTHILTRDLIKNHLLYFLSRRDNADKPSKEAIKWQAYKIKEENNDNMGVMFYTLRSVKAPSK
ncbi:MAG: hypothetical protein GOVbin630_148 [Prokaryotic dsDNA virus sp.]|nr:MAG: hypothetical protein GOVbin630_148 [Prokaryotic dsDNA virus sp.]|tara:strand:- start:10411 stop:10830 length:420 start_codon:yes stop_codon:yes gene_type:complete